MGFVPCPFACHSSKNSESQSDHLQSELTSLSYQPESTCLYSQPSLPSVPSLITSQSSQHHHSSSTTTHHQCISTLKPHSSHVFSLALSNKFLYSGSSDKEIRVWNHNPSNPESPPSNSTNNIVAIGNGAVKSLVISGDKLFSAHQDHKIRVWQIDEADETHTHTHHRKYKCLATLPTLSDRLTRLIQPKNHVRVRRHKKCTWVHHVDAISALALSRDGSLLYSVSWDRTFKIWRTSDYRCLESVGNAHDDAINAVALSNNGFIYTGSADKKIKVWKKVTGEKKHSHSHSLVAILEKHESAVNALALSTNGSTLYSGACDRSIVVWEKYSGDGGGDIHMVVVGALRGHKRAILCLAVVSDLVCSGSTDKTVRIWRKISSVDGAYSCLAVMEGHRGPVKCLIAAMDMVDHHNCRRSLERGTCNYVVYSGSLDCDIKVWQILVPSS